MMKKVNQNPNLEDSEKWVYVLYYNYEAFSFLYIK